MKNSLLLFLIICCTFFIYSSNSAYSQFSCPSGYSSVELPMNINGCPYNIQICYKCGIGPTPAIIEIKGWYQLSSPPCYQSWTFHQVSNYIFNYLSSFQTISTYLCTGLIAPPCPDQSTAIEFRTWVCWNITKINYLNETIYLYSPCDTDNYCSEIYTYCWDSLLGDYVKTHIYGPELNGTINCTLEPEEVELPRDFNQPSDCFIYPSGCN
jgi:hypothetical protein